MTSESQRKVLFVYYSFTQQTRRVADAMAEVLRGRGCDVTLAGIEFTDPHYGGRFSKLPMPTPIAKIVGMLPAQLRRKTGEIRVPPEAARDGYELVVLGAPTWWLTTCMPMRSYLHDRAAKSVLANTPFATYTTSRRYYKNNLKTMRELGEANGGEFVDDIHFVADGNQVMSMWSWLAFMRHNEEKQRSLGVRLPKPNLKGDFEDEATTFINVVADKVLGGSGQPAADAG